MLCFNFSSGQSCKTKEFFTSCELNPCFNNPCGANADCESRGRSAVCRCRSGYVGDPFVNCALEPCSQDPCGTNAECESQGRSAICKCPRGYTGDPYTNCVKDPCSTNPCGKIFLITSLLHHVMNGFLFKVLMLFVKTMEMLLYADVLQTMLEIHMSHARKL